MPNPASPSPAPPATPPPTPPVRPSPAPAPADGHPPELADAFKALDALDAPVEPPAPKTPEPSKKEDEPSPAPKDGLPPKDGPKPAPAPKTDDLEPPAVRTPKELRQWARSQAQRAKEKEAEVAQLKEKLAKLESAGGNTDRLESAIKERVATLEKQLADKENQIKLSRFEQSDEYKNRFLEPWRRAEKQAYDDVAQLDIVSVDPDTHETKIIRAGKPEDFQEIYHLSLGNALRRSKELFGQDGSSIIMSHWQKLHGLAHDSAAEIEKYKNEATKKEQEETARHAAEQEGLSRMWEQTNRAFIDKYQNWFGERDDDPDGNQLLQQGLALSDSWFSNQSALTPQQRVILAAQMRLRAAAFPRLVRDLKQKETELETLKKELTDYKNSSPGAPKRSADGKFVSPDAYTDPMAALDALPG